MKRYMLLVLKLGLLLALLVAAATTQDLRKIWELIAGANFYYAALFVIVHAMTAALGSGNLFLLLKPLGRTLAWRRLLFFDLLSLAGSYYTPGGIGGLGGMILLMSKEGVGLKDSAVAVLADKGITLFVALLFGAVYVKIYGGVFEVEGHGLTVMLLITVLGGVVMLTSRWVRQSVAKIVDRLQCYKGHYSLLLTNITITAIIFCLQGLQFYWAFSAAEVRLSDWFLVLLSYGILAIISQLPITFGGAGLSEAAAVLLWAGLGIGSEQAIAIFLLIRVFTFLATLVLGGGASVVWLFERRKAAAV